MKEIEREPNLPAPTDCFGNEQPMAVWYECPHCRQESPLTRQWVGLTEKEAWECWVSQDHTKSWQNIEAKLREKNHG